MKSLLIPIVLLLAPSLSAQGGFLGVELDPENDQNGAAIAVVQDKTAAALAGLQAGDRVLAVNDIEISSSPRLVEVLSGLLAGDFVTLKLVRGDQVLIKEMILGRRPGADLDFPLDRLPEGSPSLDWLQKPEIDRLWPDHPFPSIEFPWVEFPRVEFPPFEFLPMDFPAWGEDWSGLGRNWPFDMFPQEGAERSVHVRYPGDTPEEERAAMIAEAREKYGAEAVIEFKGSGTSITIQNTFRSDSSSADETEESDF